MLRFMLKVLFTFVLWMTVIPFVGMLFLPVLLLLIILRILAR